MAVSDTSGAVQERHSYTPYGVVTKLSPAFGASSATIAWNEILYCGYRYDSGAGLYYVRNGYYHPELRLWASRDPLDVPCPRTFGYRRERLLTPR